MNQTRNEIVTALLTGECQIIYKKLDGEIRYASGTLNQNLIPVDKLPKGPKVSADLKEEKPWTSKPPVDPNDLVHYYDTAAGSWRCFFPENLQSLSIGS